MNSDINIETECNNIFGLEASLSWVPEYDIIMCSDVYLHVFEEYLNPEISSAKAHLEAQTIKIQEQALRKESPDGWYRKFEKRKF